MRKLAALGALSLLCLPAFADDLLAPEAQGTAPTPAQLPVSGTENPAPSLGSPAGSHKDAVSNPIPNAAPAPEAQPAIPLSTIPGKTAASPSAPAAPAGPGKSIYEEFDDYLDREKALAAHEKDYSQRNLFPHENGAWQLGLIYARNAFNGYDFNWRPPAGASTVSTYASTHGANLSITYFPLRSLDFGRFGVGLLAGVYWSTFSTTTNRLDDATGTAIGQAVTKASPQQVTTAGIRAVYEFDYFLGQIVVPYVFLGIDRVLIKGYTIEIGSQVGKTQALNIPERQITSQNFGAGVHLNLNRIDSIVASKALVNVGVKKFYLSYHVLQRRSSLAGLTHNLGLNFEF